MNARVPRESTPRNGPLVKSRGVGVNFPAVPIESYEHKARADVRFAEQRKILISYRRLVTLRFYLPVDTFRRL